jgi:hypothetical protein
MTPQEISKLQGYLRKVFGSKLIAVRARPQKQDEGDMFIGDRPLAKIVVDEEDGDRCFLVEWSIREAPQPLSAQELVRIQTYMREKLGSKNLSVRARGRLKDSAEVFVGEESIGTLSVAKDCYEFEMAILDMDLDEMA